jgi:hypothetical protein
VTDNFWASRLAPTQPVEQAPIANGTAYRAWQASKPAGGSGSRMYDLPLLSEQRREAQPRSIYATAPAKALDDYKSAPRTSPLARRQGESAHGYLARTNGLLRHADELDEATQGVLAKDRADAEAEVEGKSVDEMFAAQRAVNDARSASIGGIQQQGYRGDGGFGGEQQVERLGGSAMPDSVCGARLPSIVAIAAKLRQEEEQRLAAIPQRTTTDHLKPSGDGLVQVPGAAL